VADPLTLSALGAAALTEGIKFLYSQVTELLKRRRERPAAPPALPELAAKLEPIEPDGAALARLEPDLKDLRRLLGDYVDGIEPVDPADQRLLETMDAVRRLLEAIYRQRITFPGEDRPESGPLVEGEVDVITVAGYAAAVRARNVSGPATIHGTGKAGEVAAGGQFIGADIDTIGDR
jgi:hypothetical protein